MSFNTNVLTAGSSGTVSIVGDLVCSGTITTSQGSGTPSETTTGAAITVAFINFSIIGGDSCQSLGTATAYVCRTGNMLAITMPYAEVALTEGFTESTGRASCTVRFTPPGGDVNEAGHFTSCMARLRIGSTDRAGRAFVGVGHNGVDVIIETSASVTVQPEDIVGTGFSVFAYSPAALPPPD